LEKWHTHIIKQQIKMTFFSCAVVSSVHLRQYVLQSGCNSLGLCVQVLYSIPRERHGSDVIPLNHKKRDILFLTITLANLSRFL